MKRTTYKVIGDLEDDPRVVEVPQPKVKGDGVELNDHEQFHRNLEAVGIFYVPRNIYQILYDMAPRSNDPKEHEVATKRSRVFLDAWVAENYPDWILASFADFSSTEAKAIHPALNWGMYVQLVPTDVMKSNAYIGSIHEKLKKLCYLERTTKQLGY